MNIKHRELDGNGSDRYNSTPPSVRNMIFTVEHDDFLMSIVLNFGG